MDISCIANNLIEQMVFNELSFFCRVKGMYNQEIRPKTGAPAIFSDEIEADFALYLKHCSFLRVPHTRQVFQKDILHFVQYKQLQVPTRKPVGFMQSCCFVFVGILSTYE